MHTGQSPAVSILGVPFDANSSYLRGTAQAPPKIRAALFCDSTNMWTESGRDLGRAGVLRDAGDLSLPEDTTKAFAEVEQRVSTLLDEEGALISLGGDHSITYPLVKAFGKKFPGLTVVHFDAHPDLYDQLDGNRYSHACPFARILEDGCARRLIQLGIRTMNGHQREQAERFGVEVVDMKSPVSLARLNIAAPVYVSFDMDVLDPAFAIGVSHWEPGGMSVRDAIGHIQSLNARIAGADIVEYNPARDVGGVTAMVAAKVLKEIADRMLSVAA